MILGSRGITFVWRGPLWFHVLWHGSSISFPFHGQNKCMMWIPILPYSLCYFHRYIYNSTLSPFHLKRQIVYISVNIHIMHWVLFSRKTFEWKLISGLNSCRGPIPHGPFLSLPPINNKKKVLAWLSMLTWK